ncbi:MULTISPECIES: dihydrodipicolinate synthase family protein [Bacillus]|uniref:Dihydrodipicolinate synthase family protein n=2 Tax=Bacillus TaxID=1386 RepID=A0A0M4FWZ1_9BACI|nr:MULTISPECIES: dihydrodipicolinate synthase family protein [Bacillus]ALC81513.1 hypothetical protein AM592_07815 [Bacillus gobiensis]MBP1080562.1 hypothetical protein [Bacillus capparidis]MED1094418.1 dihydrodipicolinate synthase family protein [Bacillus capparidis]
MSTALKLPRADGSLYLYQQVQKTAADITPTKFKSRIAFSAAHVVCDPFTDTDPILQPKIDWEDTLKYRHYLWSHGFAVAEAMDTAQRGMGLGWESSQELIRRSIAEARSIGARIACGAGTDQLLPGAKATLSEIQQAYEEQCSLIEKHGGQIILMASRALAQAAEAPEDYDKVYGSILNQVSEPVILHWLGDMFDPALKGYWGHNHINEAMEICLNIIWDHKEKVDGIKISLLDASQEVKMRQLLPDGVRMYTGDDFHFPELILGDESGYSNALLGIFDAIAPAASLALHSLDTGNIKRYEEIMAKTVPLSKHIFQKPTYSYKTGIVFMAYLNGHQSHFRMIGGAESARSIVHLADLYVLADQAGLLSDPDLAAERMKKVLALAGIE